MATFSGRTTKKPLKSAHSPQSLRCRRGLLYSLEEIAPDQPLPLFSGKLEKKNPKRKVKAKSEGEG